MTLTPLRLFAIAIILAGSAMAWVVLGGTTQMRTDTADANLRGKVGSLWGEPQVQTAPTFAYTEDRARHAIEIAGSDITAAFDLDQRKKGLLWYATYKVDFAGAYRVTNPAKASDEVEMRFSFPTPEGQYDGFAVSIDGRDVPIVYRDGLAVASLPLKPGASGIVRTGYRAQGLDEWSYAPAPAGTVGVVRDFTLTMSTDFADVDFPEGSVAPTEEKVREGNGWKLTWRYDSLVSGRPIALAMPKPINPGPLASRISLFAPVALLFYFAAMVLLTATSGVRLHPMHYGFLAAGFFAFHLLFSYLVDRIDINLAFAICSVVSVGLCVGYLRAVVGSGRALIELAVSQFVFLVLFSYSFFFEGLTGLAVSIGSVLTLAYFMTKTAKTDWDAVFAKPAAAQPATWNAQHPTPPRDA